MNRVLYKLITKRFYELNLGLFLLILFLAFGLISGRDLLRFHMAVMEAVTDSWTASLAAAGVSILYTVKCMAFVLRTIREPQNSFIFELQCLGKPQQVYLLLRSHLSIYMPLLIYALLSIGIGFTEAHILRAITFLLFQLLISGIAIAIYYYHLNSSWKQALSIPLLYKGPHRRPFYFYLLYYSLHSRKATFILIKFLSILILQLMLAVNTDQLNRESVCVLIIFLISAHSLLPTFYVTFMELQLGFSRNLPISTARRFAVYAFTYSLIFLPELAFLMLHTHTAIPLSSLLSLYALAISQMLLFTAILYIKGLNTNRYTLFVVLLFFASIFTLTALHLSMLFIIELIVSWLLFSALYNRYEYHSE